MGWSSGSEIAEEFWDLVKDYIPSSKQRKYVARKLIAIVEDFDCDTIEEATELCEAAGLTWDDETGERSY